MDSNKPTDIIRFAVLGSCVSADSFYGELGRHVAYFSGRSTLCARAQKAIDFELLDGYHAEQ